MTYFDELDEENDLINVDCLLGLADLFDCKLDVEDERERQDQD